MTRNPENPPTENSGSPERKMTGSPSENPVGDRMNVKEEQEHPSDWRVAAIAIAIMIMAAGIILAAGIAIWNNSAQGRLPEAKQTEANIERFNWASPECVVQEVKNPGYINNRQNLRLCGLEKQVEEMRQQLDALKPDGETPEVNTP